MEEKPNRRRPRSYVRIALIAAVVLTIPIGWTAYSLNWTRQRRAMADEPNAMIFFTDRATARAPCGLWLLGESRIKLVIYEHGTTDPADLERAKRLFPEAEFQWRPLSVVIVDSDKPGYYSGGGMF